MANEIKIAAESRSEFGKGASRRIRAAHKVPAVMYGHGTDPVHITLPGHETLLALRTANALLSISIDGGKEQLALPKQVQRDPIKGFLEHVDLVIVRRGEKVTVEVPLVILGEDKLDEGMVMPDMQAITLEVEATNIPKTVEVDVTGFGIGHQVTVADLALPEGSAYHGDSADLVLTVNAIKAEAVDEAEAEGAEDADAPAEAAEADAE